MQKGRDLYQIISDTLFNNNVGNYSIMALNPDEFPSEPILESISNINLDTELMQDMINNTYLNKWNNTQK